MAFYIFREDGIRPEHHAVSRRTETAWFSTMDTMMTAKFSSRFRTNLLSEEQDKQAALTFLTCGDAVAYMHEFFKVMLKGQYSQIAR